MTRWVERDADGRVVGHYANPQPGFAEEELPVDHPDLAAYRARLLPQRRVPKTTIVTRLAQAGKLAAAVAARAQWTEVERELWAATVDVAPDDQRMRAFLAAIGANPDQILAP